MSRKASKKPAKTAPVKATKAAGLKPGATAPVFNLLGLKGAASSKELKGKKVVLYFYPKDDTSGCTKEACGFQKNLGAFKKAGAVVIGVSRDNLTSHAKFARKYKLAFNLASDEQAKTANAFGAWVQKSMYGRKYMGLDRSTFLIGKNGKIVNLWRKVKVPGHVEEVLAAVKKSA